VASPAGPSSRASVVRWLVRGASVLVSVAVIDYLVLPQLAGTRKALHLLGSMHPWWAD
jgi:hypothetical protein